MKKTLVLFAILLLHLQAAISQVTYTNPILAGFYPDPSICKVNGNYYLVTSSFAYFPGLPIFQSNDLVNWKQIGHAMDRREQLDLKNVGISRGLFAPTIRYHKGIFYIICTLIDKGGNFIITAKDPAGPWSNPVYLPAVNGIDPSLYFDEDNDSAYIVYNSIPPDNISIYNGHRTIRIIRYNLRTQKTEGSEKIIVNGGTDISKKPVWIEAPHILKKDGWYYLICAEGGTGYNHSEVVFRSRAVDGPFIPWDKNPILTQRHLDPARPDPITTTGHADFVQTGNGDWYAVFLGCRPYEGDYYNNGRETFMTPVEWKDGWPVINPGNELVKYHYPVPYPQRTKKENNPFNRNVQFFDEFKSTEMSSRYIYINNCDTSRFDRTLRKGYLSMPLKPDQFMHFESLSFTGFRQSNLENEVTVSLDFHPAAGNEQAGLVIFQNTKAWYFISKTGNGKQDSISLYKSGTTGAPELVTSVPFNGAGKTLLKISSHRDHYSFSYASKKGQWILLKDKVDAKELSTKQAGGFVGCVYGMYVTSQGKHSSSVAQFDWFRYEGKDEFPIR